MRNWSGSVEYSTSDLATPRSLAELQELVTSSPRVRGLGSRHSFSTVADTTGLLISTAGLGEGVELDQDAKLAWVTGGSTYAQIGPKLEAAGWALDNLGSLPHISVAGACATGTHGSGVRNACLAAQVEAVELVDGRGEIVEFRSAHPDFPGLVLALGSLGVVTKHALRMQPSYHVLQDVVLDVPMSTFVDRALEILGCAYSVSAFISFRDRESVDAVWRKQRADEEPTDDTWGGHPATKPAHPVPGLDPRAATEQLRSPGPWHERLPHFRPSYVPSAGDEIQSEFFVPRGSAQEALSAVIDRADDFASALQVMEIRTIAADELWLSPFHDRDSLAIHATWISDMRRVRPALEALQGALAAFRPRPHWGKLFLGVSPQSLHAEYSAIGRFQELAQRLDPERRFVNDFVTSLGLR